MKSKVLILYISIFCLGCKTTFENFNKKSDRNQFEFIDNNLSTIEGSELGIFISRLDQENVDLTNFESLFKEKLQNSKYPYDMFVLIDFLLRNEENIVYIESTLNARTSIWDSGNWGEVFWTMISTNNLNVTTPNYFSVDDQGIKNYNFIKFLNEKIANEELGTNPLLTIDYNITNYERGKLIETVDSLNIRQVDYFPKSKTVSLFGKIGIDGKIDILTK